MTLEKIATNVRDQYINDHSHGECLLGSVRLVEALRDYGIDAQVVCGLFYTDRKMGGSIHYWVLAEEKFVDITGDQFNKMIDVPIPRVFIEKADNTRKRYRDERVIPDAEVLEECLSQGIGMESWLWCQDDREREPNDT